jgi:TP901 family phage tail tape measure protein
MVTDKTIADLWNQYDDYAKIANDLGQSTESVIKSSALYYQQGLSTNEAFTLTKDTMKLATLANIDFEQSTKLMTAALRAFHMELDSGAHITDVYSELAANAAANVQDIAYAMSKTSSIAASAGMSFENTAAMLTTMIEVT